MLQRDYRDIVAGGLLLLTGAFIVWHGLATLELGTLRRMGPGMFPASIGAMLAIFGLVIAVPAFFRAGPAVEVDWAPCLAVMAGIAAFALTMGTFGLLPAVAALVVVSSLAERTFRPIALIVMAVIVPALSWLVFGLGLGLPLTFLRWPFA